MNSVNLILEVENADEAVRSSALLLLRHSFGKYLRVFVQVQYRMIAQRLTVETIGARLVDSYPPGLCFVRNFRLFNECLYQILDGPRLGY